MPLRFPYICNLLEKLHHIFARHPPYLPRDVQQMTARVITLWFKKHELKIKHELDGFLLLSILLPEKYVDRIYGLSERDLAKVVGRAFSLSTAQFDAVLNKANPGDMSDLGHRVELITRQCVDRLPYSRTYDVSVEEIDQVLSTIASQHCIASRPSQSHPLKSFSSALNDKLAPLYQCLHPRERKWLTRLILKSYSPIRVPEDLIFSLYHPLLPGLILVSFDLKAALGFIRRLEEPPASLPAFRHEQLAGDRAAAQTKEGDRTVSEEQNTDIDGLQVVEQTTRVSSNTQIESAAREAASSTRLDQGLTRSTSSNARAAGAARNTTSSPAKGSQPLSDITSSVRNNSPNKARAEKLPAVVGRELQSSRRTSSQDASISYPSNLAQSSTIHCRKLVCPREGRHCLFHKKDIGLLPSISKSARLRKLLDKHRVHAMSFETFITAHLKASTRTSRAKRRILLVDRSLNGVEEAVKRLKAISVYDGNCRREWVDVYDWRLLEFVDKHGSCHDSKLEGIRRYWIGTV